MNGEHQCVDRPLPRRLVSAVSVDAPSPMSIHRRCLSRPRPLSFSFSLSTSLFLSVKIFIASALKFQFLERLRTMARTVLLVALCVLISAMLSEGLPFRNPFVVQGRVYCDTCRAGFETSATTYIAGARVRVECKDRKTLQLVYSQEGSTDSTGTYSILVTEDHEDQFCDAMVISSPKKDCASASEGRDRARVILTRNNGISSNYRFVNALGFMRDEAISGCDKILRQYQEDED